MSKKIIELSNEEIKNILIKNEKSKGVLPPIDFIFLSEEEKEKYFGPGNIYYIKSNNNYNIINIYNINLNINDNNILKYNKFSFTNGICTKTDRYLNNSKNNPKEDADIEKYQDPEDLCNIFKDSIKHILFAKPFYEKIKNISLNVLEYNFLKNDLLKKGIDINAAFEGCLDCIRNFV
jgi:hypothetical protein